MAAMTNAQRRRYELLYESCLTRPNRKASVNALAKRIRANRTRYQKVGKAVGVPWWQPAFTGSMLSHCRRIPRSAVQPGDLVVWTPPRTGQHVCVVIQGGADPMLVSHGDDSGPKKLRFSAEDAYQRRHGHGTAVWLSAF
jgi:hypothetical protein